MKETLMQKHLLKSCIEVLELIEDKEKIIKAQDNWLKTNENEIF